MGPVAVGTAPASAGRAVPVVVPTAVVPVLAAGALPGGEAPSEPLVDEQPASATAATSATTNACFLPTMVPPQGSPTVSVDRPADPSRPPGSVSDDSSGGRSQEELGDGGERRRVLDEEHVATVVQ